MDPYHWLSPKIGKNQNHKSRGIFLTLPDVDRLRALQLFSKFASLFNHFRKNSLRLYSDSNYEFLVWILIDVELGLLRRKAELEKSFSVMLGSLADRAVRKTRVFFFVFFRANWVYIKKSFTSAWQMLGFFTRRVLEYLQPLSTICWQIVQQFTTIQHKRPNYSIIQVCQS